MKEQIKKALANMLGFQPTIEPTCKIEKLEIINIEDLTMYEGNSYIVECKFHNVSIMAVYCLNNSHWSLVAEDPFVGVINNAFDLHARNEIEIILFQAVNLYASLKRYASIEGSTFESNLPYEYNFKHAYTFEDSKITWKHK